jgi:hypothetical protein
MELYVGASLERPPGPKYASELPFAELLPQQPLPKPGTMLKWRASLPDGFQLALRIPDPVWKNAAGPLRDAEALQSGLDWLSSAAESLEASLLVLDTGASITTGARDRDRLRRFVDRLPRREGTEIVWRAGGLWEFDAVQSLARSLGIIGAFDPIEDPAPAGELIYGALVAEGLRRSFSHALLLEVIEGLFDCEARRAYLTIDSAQSFREARLLRSILEGNE